MKPVDAIHRKLQSLRAVLEDAAATEHERATAQALKTRLEQKLKDAGVPQGDWSDALFRLGRSVQAINKATTPPPAMGGPSKLAFRLGRTVGKGLKKFRST